MNDLKSQKERITWIDLAKGIAMILVIMGHTLKEGLPLFLIYTFHIPLFFCLSTITSHFSTDMNDYTRTLKRSFVHLLLPAIVFWALHGISYYALFHRQLGAPVQYFGKQLLSLLWASGQDISISSLEIPMLGIFWFVFALFVGRSIFDYIHLRGGIKATVVLSLSLGIMGVLVGSRQPLPFAFDCALAIQPFLALGMLLREKKRDKASFPNIVISLSCWALLAVLSVNVGKMEAMDVALRQYPLFPVCILIAATGSVAFCELAKLVAEIHWIKESSRIFRGLLFLGKNSLWLMCIHYMDGLWRPIYSHFENNLLTVTLRVLLDCAACFAFVLCMNKVVPILKNRMTKRKAL